MRQIANAAEMPPGDTAERCVPSAVVEEQQIDRRTPSGAGAAAAASANTGGGGGRDEIDAGERDRNAPFAEASGGSGRPRQPYHFGDAAGMLAGEPLGDGRRWPSLRRAARPAKPGQRVDHRGPSGRRKRSPTPRAARQRPPTSGVFLTPGRRERAQTRSAISAALCGPRRRRRVGCDRPRPSGLLQHGRKLRRRRRIVIRDDINAGGHHDVVESGPIHRRRLRPWPSAS